VCREEADHYADELGVARPNAVTTTKPSGTISLLNSSSPGIHAPFAPYFIRRARLADNDPMAQALMDAGVKWELDQYDSTGHTLAFEFPMKAPHTRITVQTENIQDQFERQAMIQEWWADNSVSATLSFDPETEKELTGHLLKEFVPKFKSTSMLTKSHGYVQAPYEQITEEQYRQMRQGVREDHPLVHGGEVEIEECANGVCPVR
jgi:ribonucleotide reductase alpha subunit